MKRTINWELIQDRLKTDEEVEDFRIAVDRAMLALTLQINADGGNQDLVNAFIMLDGFRGAMLSTDNLKAEPNP